MHQAVEVALHWMVSGRPSIRVVGFIEPAATLVSIVFLVIGVIIGVIRAVRHPAGIARSVVVGLALWVAATAYLTMLPGHGGRINLVPFDFGSGATAYEPLTNVALFVPLGILLAVLGWRGIAVVGVGFGLSLIIETTQYLLNDGRTADVNDVIANTLGTLIGWVVVAVVRRRRRGFDTPAARATQPPGESHGR